MPLVQTPHFSQTILDAIVEILSATDVTEAGEKVFESRDDPLEEGTETPSISVFEGVDEPVGDTGQIGHGYLDSILSVHIVLAAKPLGAVTPLQVLRIMRAQVHRALMADPTLGLGDAASGVVQVWPSGAEEPTIGPDGDRPTATLETLWSVHYRTTREDPA